LTAPEPTHPEYLAQLQAVTQRRDTKIRQEHALQYYETQALVNQTLVERAQMHSQFYQEAREARDNHLDALGKKWYDIQKERRSQLQPDQAGTYTYKFPTNFADQIRNQRNYNQEVSLLSGIQKYRGFPAAPDIDACRPSELDDDLQAMKVRVIGITRKASPLTSCSADPPLTATTYPTTAPTYLPEPRRPQWSDRPYCSREMG